MGNWIAISRIGLVEFEVVPLGPPLARAMAGRSHNSEPRTLTGGVCRITKTRSLPYESDRRTGKSKFVH